ncbi:MAG: CvpA family protein [Clostridia bacterium]|nr:CvpA family protein [Clostridia bacterium]
MIWNLCATQWTNYIVDIVVLAVILGFMIVSARKGFIVCFFSFVTGFAAVLAALLLAKPFLNLTGGLFGLRGVFENAFVGWFGKLKGFDLDISNQGLQAALADKNLPKFLVNLVVDNFGNETLAAGTTLAMLVGESVAKLAAMLLSGILVFALVKLLLRLLKKVLLAIADKITLIGKLDSLLGALVGLLEGFLIVCVVLAVLSLIPSASITEYFNSTLFVGGLYNKNPLHLILGWVMN